MGKGKSCSHDDKFCVVFTHRVSLVGSGIELCQFLSMFSMFTCNEIGPETDLHFFFVYSREKATVVKWMAKIDFYIPFRGTMTKPVLNPLRCLQIARKWQLLVQYKLPSGAKIWFWYKEM